MTGRATIASRWYAIYTKHRHERVVRDRLSLQGFTVYVADFEARAQWGNRERRTVKNLLPGYAFVRTAMNTANYLAIVQTPSVVKVVGRAWPELSWIEDEQLLGLQLLLESRERFQETEYWSMGDKVEVVAGPLRSLRGFYAGQANSRDHVILSIDLLQRSVAVEVDRRYLRRLGERAVA